MEELRHRLRPSEALVHRHLAEVFARNEQYQYVIRPGRQAEAEQFMKQGLRMMQGLERLRAELKDWSVEVAALRSGFSILLSVAICSR